MPDSYGVFSFLAPFKRPLVLRAHGNNTYSSHNLGTKLSLKTKFYERNLYRKADAVCAVSNYTAKIMQKVMSYKKEIRIIHNGIDLKTIDNLCLDTNTPSLSSETIVYSGRLTRTKGVFELVGAIIELLKKNYNVIIYMNGRDTVDNITGKSVQQELIDSIPNEYLDKFIFSGFISRDKLFAQYKSCNLAIFPSYTEAFAMAPLESMACAKPTIYSNLCSGEELIENTVDGLLVNPKSVHSIVESIEWILNNHTDALIMGKKGREKVENKFSKNIMTQNTINYYEQIAASYNIQQRN